ncbi:MAG: DMT family transporter [Promethearchaeota archaeon]
MINKKAFSIFLLVLTTVLWGSTFILTKISIEKAPIFFFLGMRFSLALLVFIPFTYRLKSMNKKLITVGLITGFVYFLGIAVQTIGLKLTTAGKGGFITGLNTIIVPFFARFFYKKRIRKEIWLAAIISTIGMGLLSLEADFSINIGDIYILVCAVFFALYIILVDKYVGEVDIYLFLLIQLIIITVLCFLLSLLINENVAIKKLDYEFWIILFYLGCIAAGLTFIFQNWGQKYVGPSQTAIIFALEPVMALLFASYLIGNEQITVKSWFGSILIFIGILITVLTENKNKRKNICEN